MSSLTELDLAVKVFKETNALAYLPAASIKKKKVYNSDNKKVCIEFFLRTNQTLT